ncbi:hypothetical protein A2160_03460 [Candidatus Beckwithbacteria bacterium RBG_13_42_9]|uniref:RNHCP domain-containing protein n=1 Tax=Candidatus Beckwithbacteria bacterium RBG_13_42_9 TaxID=1797457 RepID=A0A1F5E8L8_9BACT|nr:MAG: hypothetical protein A2160_03460 [Candidatus Beckwithbacteria bacterium RBG_13_42_9]
MTLFLKRNQGFICQQCGFKVLPHPSSSRDHCPRCLAGLHVDIFPGDRQNSCRGLLEPIGLQKKKGKQQIVYRCEKCHKQVVNIAAPDDNQEKIVELVKEGTL